MSLLALLAPALVGVAPTAAQSRFPRVPPDHRRTVVVGWHDEMDSRSHWSPLDVQNKAFVAEPVKGTLFLGLDHVPANWPYGFQWSGVTQDAIVDTARYPVLMARVRQVQGYAHLDIDVLGTKVEVVNTLRSSTLNDPGLSTLDLSRNLPTAVYRLRLRSIVGDPNDGRCATYDWVRFVGKGDAEFLALNPDWDRVRNYGPSMR